MQWQALDDLNLSGEWQLTQTTTATAFRLSYAYSNTYRHSPIGLVALASLTDGGIELFAPTRIQPRPEKEIIRFPTPPPGWSYSLALKLVVLPNQPTINWNVLVDMPLYNLTGADPVAAALQATTFTATTPQATNSASKILNANPNRKSASIYNPSPNTKVYLDVVSNVTPAAASIVIPPGSVYIADLPWVGDVYAVTASGNVTLQVREFV